MHAGDTSGYVTDIRVSIFIMKSMHARQVQNIIPRLEAILLVTRSKVPVAVVGKAGHRNFVA